MPGRNAKYFLMMKETFRLDKTHLPFYALRHVYRNDGAVDRYL